MAAMTQALTDAEYDRIASVLERFRNERAMNLEMLDGFFVALICSPGMVAPSEFLPEIWGGDMANNEAFSDQAEVQKFLDLVMRHWNAVVHSLNSKDLFLPVLLEDDGGVARANDWAQGFMRGMELRRDDWSELMSDEEHGGALIPILALANEHDPDPEMRPYKEPMNAERREQLIIGVAASVPAIYRYFASRRRLGMRDARESTTHRRTAPKVGRNDPCACGSGQKFKKCCGKLTLH
jgi:uncharacterized protein